MLITYTPNGHIIANYDKDENHRNKNENAQNFVHEK